jgi:hypothetical protein
MAFFKSGDALVEEGNDLIKRKDFEKAKRSFQKAIDKKTKDMDLAQVMIALLSIHGNLTDPMVYKHVAGVLRSKGDMDFQLGLSEVSAAKLAKECDLLGDEFGALGASRDPSVSAARGNALIGVAMKYQTTMPNDILLIPELFGGVSMTGMRRAQKLFAEGNEDLAESVVFTDPRKAAEYQQMAFNYRKQMGESGEANLAKIEGYSKSAACWFCGREVTGERIHFFPMSSEVGILRFKEQETSHLAVKTNAGDAVYACRGCYSAISRRADAIANHYHRQAMAEIQRVEASLRAEIAMVNSRISSINFR